jgi:hypothetical protein
MGQSQLHWCSTNSGGTLDLVAGAQLNEAQWNKLDLTYNGGIATLYLNGRQLSSASGGLRGPTAPLVLGMAAGATNFDGLVDELIIYDRARNADEIGPVAQVMWETAIINTTTNLTLQGSGPLDKNLTFAIQAGTLTNGTIDQVAGSSVVTYHAGDRKGPDSFTYTVSDGEFISPPATVVLSVVAPHWLAPQGGVQEPRDGSDAAHAWVADSAAALDAIWQTNNFYDCFFYAPGEYQSKGNKFALRTTALPGCKHIGSGTEGAGATILKLVGASVSTGEGVIFAMANQAIYCDGFEARDMVLDCNAQNNPMFSRGETNFIVIPLTTTSRVETVKLRWTDASLPASGVIPGRGTSWRIGRAQEFSLCTRRLTEAGYITNCLSLTSTGRTDVVAVGTETDQIILQLETRASGVDFYGLEEIEVTGGTVSLPAATASSSGESQLPASDSRYTILSAVDGNPFTAWASGPEASVEIVLPLRTNTPVDRVMLDWFCRTVSGVGRLGPGTNVQIRARNLTNQTYYDVPSVALARTATGSQLILFGTEQMTVPIVTDQLVLILSGREATTDYLSLQEITPQLGFVPVPMVIPTSSSALDYSVLVTFDKNSFTRWASRTQGMVGAIDISGSNIKLTGLRVVNFGTKAGREAFAMGVKGPLPWASAPIRQGNVLIEDCLVTQPATNSTDGLTAISLSSSPPHILTNAIVRRCTVRGVGQYFTYSHGFSSTHVENSLAEDCTNGIYFEPDRGWLDVVSPLMIRSNVFRNVQRGLYLAFHAGARFDSVVFSDNEIILSSFGGYAIGACDTCDPGPSGTVTNFTVLNNIIRYADWVARPQGGEGGFFYTDIQHAVVANNLIALGTANSFRVRNCPSGYIAPPIDPELCPSESNPPPSPPTGVTFPPCLDPVRPGYRRAWYNNYDLSNSLIPVRYYHDNADGLASEQQWP